MKNTEMNLKKIYRNPLSLNFKFTNTDALKNKHSHGNFYFGLFNSPFGDMFLICKETGLCGLGFTSQFGETYVLKSMKKRWLYDSFSKNLELVSQYYEKIFCSSASLNLHLIGTSFQLKVWEELLNISFNQTKSYSEIAANIGSPNSIRAVATAVGRNPISWLIPCHRVVRKNGRLGGYHWGMNIKVKMLDYERFFNINY